MKSKSEDDEQIKNYINEYFSETAIRNSEDELLRILKLRSEIFKKESYDDDWLDFTDFVIKRRLKK